MSAPSSGTVREGSQSWHLLSWLAAHPGPQLRAPIHAAHPTLSVQTLVDLLRGLTNRGFAATSPTSDRSKALRWQITNLGRTALASPARQYGVPNRRAGQHGDVDAPPHPRRTPTAWRVLQAMARRAGGHTAPMLHAATGVERGLLRQICARLAEGGWIAQVPVPGAGAEAGYVVTDHALALLADPDVGGEGRSNQGQRVERGVRSSAADLVIDLARADRGRDLCRTVWERCAALSAHPEGWVSVDVLAAALADDPAIESVARLLGGMQDGGHLEARPMRENGAVVGTSVRPPWAERVRQARAGPVARPVARPVAVAAE